MSSENPSRRERVRIELGGWVYVVAGTTLRMLVGGEEMVALPLAPVANGRQRALGAWKKVAKEHYRAPVRGLGSAHVGVREGHVAFWIETKVKAFETFTYFPGATFRGDRWQTYVSDEWDRLWDADLDQEVGLSSAFLDPQGVFPCDGAGMTDPGDFPPTFMWNMPARAFSLKTAGGYVGFSMPGALPVGVVRLTMKDRRLSVSFDALRPGCREGSMPVVYFAPGLGGAYDALDEHRVISERRGLTRKKPPDHPKWWTAPTYKPYLEQMRLTREQTDHHTDVSTEVISTKALLDWTFTVKESLKLEEMVVVLEQGIFRYYGDYTPVDALGGTAGFRKTLDGLRKKGVRAAYYINPFLVNTKVDFFREHPEAFCTPKDRSVEFKYALEANDDDPHYALIDWTHPAGRDHVLSQVEFILSDKKGCLNCDWLRSNQWRSPDPRHFDFHDPDWGIADLMSMKVQKMMYERAKAVKPDCCVNKAGIADPYMQPYADVTFISEDWTGRTDSWYRRGRIATRTLRNLAFVTAPFFLTITKSYEYYMAMMVWCICEVPDVRHAIHPYQVFRPMAAKDFKRRLCGCKVQENAPLNVTDWVRVAPAETRDDEPTIWRKRTQGRLAGWYASLALGKRAFVTYSETEARIGTTETRRVRVPMPSGAEVRSVEMVPHEGEPRKWPVREAGTGDGRWLELKVEDSAGDALYYSVKYRLGTSSGGA